MSADATTPEHARDLTSQDAIVGAGLATFLDVGNTLLAARSCLDPAAFDTFCRVHVGIPAVDVAPILAMVEAMQQ